jgi:hypothetical protein
MSSGRHDANMDQITQGIQRAGDRIRDELWRADHVTKRLVAEK